MTREETKVKTFDILHFVADNAGLSTFEAIEKAYNMGVSEQEPILDMIRAEIEAEIKGCETAIDMYKEKPDIVLCYKTFIQGYTKTLQIIDKYRIESECEG